jgi:hypothetical protein
MVALIDCKETKIEDGSAERSEVTVRENYENPGVRCFELSANQLVENHLGSRFSFDSDNDVVEKEGKGGVIWNGQYVDEIQVRIFQ